MKTLKINIRADKKTVALLKKISKTMKISQSDVISIALYELTDLLKTYPTVDYRPDLNGFLLRRIDK